MKGLIIMATFLGFLFVTYIIFSFFQATFDITQWPEKQRLTCIVVAAIATVVSIGIDELF